jgi:hypothetical protein
LKIEGGIGNGAAFSISRRVMGVVHEEVDGERVTLVIERIGRCPEAVELRAANETVQAALGGTTEDFNAAIKRQQRAEYALECVRQERDAAVKRAHAAGHRVFWKRAEQ